MFKFIKNLFARNKCEVCGDTESKIYHYSMCIGYKGKLYEDICDKCLDKIVEEKLEEARKIKFK